MTPNGVRELITLYEQGWDLPPLAEKYGVTVATVSRIITGKIWQDVTGGINRSRAGKITEFRVNYIAARLDQGCRNLSIIADELGVSRQAVSSLIKRRNIGGTSCSAQ